MLAAVSRRVLPAAVEGESPARTVGELSLGWANVLLSAKTEERFNQMS